MFEAAQVCPFNVDDISVDYQMLSSNQKTVSGLLVAATNRLIEKKVKLAKQASLDCVLMDVDGLALLNCLSECEKGNGGQTTTAVLNIGNSYTTLAIMNCRGTQSYPFVRDVAYAGVDIVKAIAEEKNMSAKDVESAIFGFDGGDSKEQVAIFKDSLEKACEKLVVDVTETLRFYTAQGKSSFVERIFVCGGFAMVGGLVELLDKQLPAKIVLWNPFEKFGCTAGQACEDMLKKKGPAMAIAAGLAMRSI
jgi:type IV pilus assembly protein PilM